MVSLRAQLSSVIACAMTALAVSGCSVFGGELSLRLVLDTGFFERRDALVSAKLQFAQSVDVRSAELMGPEGRAVPFWFEPGKLHEGTVHWTLPGDVESLTKMAFVFSVESGPWQVEPTGSETLAETVRQHTNVVPNGGFEQIGSAQPSSTWFGEQAPLGWELHDYAWRYRLLPDLASSCRPSDADAHGGRLSLKLVATYRDDAPEQPALVAPYVNGPIVDLKPDTLYQFSYWVKFTEVVRSGYVSASVNLLDAEKKQVFPRKYAINRIQAAYGTGRNLPEHYLNRWVLVSVTKRTLPDVHYGQIVLSCSAAGQCVVDDFVLCEIEMAPPITVDVSAVINE